VVERRCEVNRGDFGCVGSCCVSPFVSAGSSGTGVWSAGVLFVEEERRFVKDLSTETVRAVLIAAVSFASSKVSYQKCTVSYVLHDRFKIIIYQLHSAPFEQLWMRQIVLGTTPLKRTFPPSEPFRQALSMPRECMRDACNPDK
jgi:hypothetical protein